MQEILLKIRYFERGGSKNLKKNNLIFLLNPVAFSFNGQNYQQQKGPGTIDKLLSGYKTSSEKLLY